jgi:hypothetical protein
MTNEFFASYDFAVDKRIHRAQIPGGPDPVRLLRTFAGALRGISFFHKDETAAIIARAADDLVNHAEELLRYARRKKH